MYVPIHEPIHAIDGRSLSPDFRSASGFTQHQSANESFWVQAIVYIAVLTVVTAPIIACLVLDAIIT